MSSESVASDQVETEQKKDMTQGSLEQAAYVRGSATYSTGTIAVVGQGDYGRSRAARLAVGSNKEQQHIAQEQGRRSAPCDLMRTRQWKRDRLGGGAMQMRLFAGWRT